MTANKPQLAGLATCCISMLLLTLPPHASASTLPDGRVYEMVTPVDNNDADVDVPRSLPPYFVKNLGEVGTKLPFQVAANGESVAYVAGSTVGGTGDTANGEGNEYLARRSPKGGWEQSINLQPAGIDSAFYQAFSPDLTVGILESGATEEPDLLPLSVDAPGDGYAVLYERSLNGNNYQPFFTIEPPIRGSGSFRTFGVPNLYPVAPNELAYAGASANNSRLLFEANDALTSSATDGGPEENNLYESVGGRLTLVNVLPDGSTEPNATFGAPPLPYETKRNLPDFGGVISGDGSRVFWSDLNPGREALYVSEGVGSSAERTVQVDASQAGGSGGGGRFWTANKDGSKVFFTDLDSARLTADTEPGSGQNLYVYELPTGSPTTGHLTDLTATADAEVEGLLGEGESETGEYTLYFVAKGVLAGNHNSNGATAAPGADNLYMLHEGAQPVFVATLSPEDGINAIRPLSPSGKEEIGDWQPGLGHRTAEVTPDGKSLVFMSNNQSVNGHNEVVNGVSIQEVYIYDAENNELSCASCAREGIAPSLNHASEFGLGGFLPVSSSATYLPRWMSDDGSRVFFDSSEPLVGLDTNSEVDVYEWERDGSGSCGEAAGCVYLLSGGTSETSSFLIGGSASGDDVFFVSRAELVAGGNEAYNLFDARVDGVQPVAAPACTGTGCQGLPSPPPTFATPASATFNGVGNFPPPGPEPAKPATKPKAKAPTRAQLLRKALKACHAKRRRAGAQHTCEAVARKRYAAGSQAKRNNRKGI